MHLCNTPRVRHSSFTRSTRLQPFVIGWIYALRQMYQTQMRDCDAPPHPSLSTSSRRQRFPVASAGCPAGTLQTHTDTVKLHAEFMLMAVLMRGEKDAALLCVVPSLSLVDDALSMAHRASDRSP